MRRRCYYFLKLVAVLIINKKYKKLLSENVTNPFAEDGFDIYFFDSDEDGINVKIGYDYDFDQKIDKYVDV